VDREKKKRVLKELKKNHREKEKAKQIDMPDKNERGRGCGRGRDAIWIPELQCWSWWARRGVRGTDACIQYSKDLLNRGKRKKCDLCNGSGTSYWSDGVWGDCLECTFYYKN
jgi:hypothetical protein